MYTHCSRAKSSCASLTTCIVLASLLASSHRPGRTTGSGILGARRRERRAHMLGRARGDRRSVTPMPDPGTTQTNANGNDAARSAKPTTVTRSRTGSGTQPFIRPDRGRVAWRRPRSCPVDRRFPIRNCHFVRMDHGVSPRRYRDTRTTDDPLSYNVVTVGVKSAGYPRPACLCARTTPCMA